MNPSTGLFVCRVLSIVGAILVALGAFFMPHFTARIDKQKDGKIDELVKGKDELLSKIGKYQVDLKNKDEKIKQLEVEGRKASRGITSSYDFNGAKRATTRPGHISVNAGQEVGVFQTMLKLEKEKKFPELINICEEQIQKTPEWLTPYLFLGVACANIGEKPKAIKNLEYVLEKAPGDPAYAQAADILSKLKG